MAQGVWKEMKSSDRGIRYHVVGEDFIDEIIISEGKEKVTVKYTVDGNFVIESKNMTIEIKNYSVNHEDPYFSYAEYFTNISSVDEAIEDIKDYILYLMKYALGLE